MIPLKGDSIVFYCPIYVSHLLRGEYFVAILLYRYSIGRKKMRTVKGFTLIELLVVIAIIALLLSVIIPSLSLAKEHAMEILCENNIRQYGFAMVLYCDDNDGSFSDCEDWLYMDFVPSGKYQRDTSSLTNFECVWHNKALYPDGLIVRYLSDSKVQLCPLFPRLGISRSSCAQGIRHNPAIPIEPVFSYSQNVFLGRMGGMPIPDLVEKITLVRSPSTVFSYGEENPFAIPAGARPGFTSSASSLNDSLLYVVDPRIARSTIEVAGGKFGAAIPFTDCFGSFHKAKDSAKYLGYSKAVFVDGHIQDVVPEETLRYSWPF